MEGNERKVKGKWEEKKKGGKDGGETEGGGMLRHGFWVGWTPLVLGSSVGMS